SIAQVLWLPRPKSEDERRLEKTVTRERQKSLHRPWGPLVASNSGSKADSGENNKSGPLHRGLVWQRRANAPVQLFQRVANRQATELPCSREHRQSQDLEHPREAHATGDQHRAAGPRR